MPALKNGNRLETGPIKFGDDWPGVFIRGDNALFYAIALERCLKELSLELDTMTTIAPLRGLLYVLSSCNTRNMPL